jgi:lauroyl/myristoyl acyltransferase
MPHADRYLRTSLLLVRYQDGYLLVHPGSSVILLTDALGARVATRLIRGHSERGVRAWVESRLPGAGDRAGELMDRLETLGAITTDAPQRSPRWRIRSALSLLAGWALGVASIVVPLLPVSVLRAAFDALPHTPLAARTVGQIQPYVDANLRASGYADTSERWRRAIAWSCAAASAQTYFMMYLILVLEPPKLRRAVSALFDMESFAELERTLRDTGGGVLAGLHTSLYIGIIVLLGALERKLAVLADMTALGVNVGNNALSGLEMYGQYAAVLDSHSRMVGKAMLERLRAGELAVLAFDAPPQGSTIGAAMPRIGLMGQPVYRFDGAAWMAIRAGKPIVFVSTYQEGRKTKVYVPPPLYANPALPRRAQVEDLTARLYAAAETFLRQHPEAWMAWCYLHDLVVPDVQGEGVAEVGEHGGSEDEIVFVFT